MKRGRPTNNTRNFRYKIELSLLHYKYLIPKKFRTPNVFEIILKNELN